MRQRRTRIEAATYPRAFLGTAAPAIGLTILSGCSGPQSALDPAGPEALAVSALFRNMAVAGLLIWIVVVGLYVYASRRRRRIWSGPAAGQLVLWGGAVAPSVALGALLAYALWLMPGLRPLAATSMPGLTIEVVGHQYWWEVTYYGADDTRIVTANEVRLPVGEQVEFVLESDDVIHSFWIPPLAGKMDMIPGRSNRLRLTADRPGTFRGVCAEFCGLSHAVMAFTVLAEEPDAFDAWLAAEAAPSPAVDAPGLEAFLAEGCGACHTVRGTEADGRVGPDLSHIGARTTIGAGTLPRTAESIARFVADPQIAKPGAKMPGYHMLPSDRLDAIAVWLESLE